MEVVDVRQDVGFAARRIHTRSAAVQMEGMRRIARAFVDSPETILRELVDLAVSMCNADSAGISIERQDASDADFYHWVATAGQYSGFAAAAAMANELAHRINNPLQSLTNKLYLAAEGHHGEDARAVGRETLGDLGTLSVLVAKLLDLPHRNPS